MSSKSKSGNKRKASAVASDKDDEAVPWFNLFTKGDQEYNEYMSVEWGFEKRGERALFEKMSLEGAQSGLSWLTILRKREAYRRFFHDFDVDKVAKMTTKDVEQILQATSHDKRDIVVRHRGKIESVINNAQCVQKLRSESSLDDFLWGFVDDKPILNRLSKDLKSAPTKSQESEAMAQALKERGFKFVGPTTMYALMQSVGMVIDHPVDTPEWLAAQKRLQKRKRGYQEGKRSRSS